MALAAMSTVDLIKLESGLKAMAKQQAASGLTGGEIETEFCTIWPKAEPILKLIAPYLGIIPEAGPMASAIINGLVSAGDAASKSFCPKSAGATLTTVQ